MFMLSSCNLLNLRNVQNENKWKNKSFHTPLEVQYQFDPVTYKDYDNESFFLQGHDTKIALDSLEGILRAKLIRRNFVLTDDLSHNLLIVDTLYLGEYTGLTDVYDSEGEHLAEATNYEVRISIWGRLVSNGRSTKISADYEFDSNPRPGTLIPSMTVHHNSALNMEKVFAVLMNRFSYDAYKKGREILHSPIEIGE